MRCGGVVYGQVLRRLRPQPRRRRAGFLYFFEAEGITSEKSVWNGLWHSEVGLENHPPLLAISVIAIWWALPSTESETSRDLVLSGEYWTPPMIQHMRIEFMADCKETASDRLQL